VLFSTEKLWAPVFTKKLVDCEGLEDDSITVDCKVNGKPIPTITW